MSRPGRTLHLAHHLAAVGHLLAGGARNETGRGRELALMSCLIGDAQQHRIEACIPPSIVIVVIIVVVGTITLLAAAAGANVIVAAPLTWRRW